MSILLRRWTTQFLGLEADLEEDEPDPELLEEVEFLQGKKELLVAELLYFSLVFVFVSFLISVSFQSGFPHFSF